MAPTVKRITLAPTRLTMALLLLGYISLRALNLVELAVASQHQAASGPANLAGQPSDYFVHTETAASPAIGGVLANWDGQWYERIGVDGYPTGSDNRSTNDAWTWAFPPLFPLAVRAVMALTGVGFTWSAVLLNLLLGAVATVLAFVLFRAGAGDRLALGGALLIGAFPSAPLFMLAFSEPLALVLVLAILLTVSQHRPWWTIPFMLALAFTRPIAAPLAVVIGIHWWAASRAPYRRPGPVFKVGLSLGILVALASPWLWGALSTMLMGDGGQLATSGAERTTSIIRRFDFGWPGAIYRSAGAPTLVLFLALTACVLAGASIAAIRLSVAPEVVAWGVAYVAFVLVVTPLHTAIFRYLLLATPLLVTIPLRLLATRKPVGIAMFVLLLVASLWLQWFWVRYIYIVDPAPALLPFAA